MLLRKLQEPIAAVSERSRQAEDALYLRLEERAREKPFLLDCSVQHLADNQFVVVLSDHDSGDEVCAWTGSADAIVVEFDGWLSKRFPEPAVPGVSPPP